jgi:hypothetical protein
MSWTVYRYTVERFDHYYGELGYLLVEANSLWADRAAKPFFDAIDLRPPDSDGWEDLLHVERKILDECPPASGCSFRSLRSAYAAVHEDLDEQLSWRVETGEISPSPVIVSVVKENGEMDQFDASGAPDSGYEPLVVTAGAVAPFISKGYGYVTVKVMPDELQVAVQNKAGQGPALRDRGGNQSRKWFELTEKMADMMLREGWMVDMDPYFTFYIPQSIQSIRHTGTAIKWASPHIFSVELADPTESRAALSDLRQAAKSLGWGKIYVGNGDWPVESFTAPA